MILSWSKNTRDLVLLRNFLEAGSYYDILPPDANCVPIVPQFRRNLPDNVPLSSNSPFPLLFPGHELVGRNHRALADVLQLRLMVKTFEKLCQPVKQGDLSLLSRAMGDRLLKAKHEKVLQQTPLQLKKQNKRDQRFVEGKKRKGEAASDNKQKPGPTQLKLD
jgi:hypothetical protein